MLFNFPEKSFPLRMPALKSDIIFFTQLLKPRHQRISESSTLAKMKNTSWESFWEPDARSNSTDI